MIEFVKVGFLYIEFFQRIGGPVDSYVEVVQFVVSF